MASIKPIDEETILQSVEKTGRCVIVHEAPLSGGIGGEIAALLAEKSLMHLLAPVKRVAGFDITMPYFKMEKQYLPSVAKIINTVKETLEFA